MQKINLQEPQRKRNANANFVNLIRTSTVLVEILNKTGSAIFPFGFDFIAFEGTSFSIFMHSLEPFETPSNSRLQTINNFLKYRKTF